MKELAGKNAVVTGAGSGIGFALARALARENANVALLDIDDALLAEARDAVATLGVRAQAYRVDVGDRAAVHAAAARVERDLGAVHVLCDNAGVAFRGPALDETPDETFDWMFNVNVSGMFNVAKAFITQMRRHRKGGHVVLTGSIAGLHAMRGRRNGIYSATKMAVVGLAEFLRETLPAEGIGVSVLCPGNVVTRAQQSGRWRQERYGGPFEREGANLPRSGMDPDDVGRIVVRGIQDDAFYIFTHPSDRTYVEERFAGMIDAFERWTQVLPELGIDPTLPAA